MKYDILFVPKKYRYRTGFPVYLHFHGDQFSLVGDVGVFGRVVLVEVDGSEGQSLVLVRPGGLEQPPTLRLPKHRQSIMAHFVI